MPNDAPFMYADERQAPKNWEGTGLRTLAPPMSQGGPSAGMRGTQSGPADESNTMAMERVLQRGSAIPLGALAGAGGLIASGGNPFAAVPGLGAAVAVDANADQPNIRDTWADKLRMLIQGYQSNPESFY